MSRGAELSIEITKEVREDLRSTADAGLRSAPDRVESGGILTSPLNDDAGLVVDGTEIVPCSHRYGPAHQLSPDELDRMRKQAERIRAAGNCKIAGYFRTCIGDRFKVFPDDQAIMREILPESRFILLVKPLPASLSIARLFERNPAGDWYESAHFELLPSASVAVSPAAPRFSAAVPAPQGRRLNWLRFVGGAIVVALLPLAWYESLQRPNSRGSVAPLGLRVTSEGDSFSIVWDRSSPALKLASDGILRIVDGGRRRELILDSTQIQTGSILYRPASDDVTFSLELHRNGATVANESVRTLDGSRSHAPAEAAATVPTPAPEAKLRRIAPAPTQIEAPPVVSEQPASVPPAQPVAAPPSPTPNQDAAARQPEPPAASIAKPPAPPDPVPSKPVEPKAVATAAPVPTVPTPEEPPRTVARAGAPPVVTLAKPLKKFVPNMRNLGFAPLSGSPEIEVQVSIDASGRVTEAHALNAGKKISQMLRREAVDTAKKWIFEPATSGGKAVPSTHLITFRFVPGS